MLPPKFRRLARAYIQVICKADWHPERPHAGLSVVASCNARQTGASINQTLLQRHKKHKGEFAVPPNALFATEHAAATAARAQCYFLAPQAL